jgi:hypothetical protein
LGWVEHLIGTGKLGDKNLICPTEECSFLISDWQGLEEFLGQEKYMGYCEQVF